MRPRVIELLRPTLERAAREVRQLQTPAAQAPILCKTVLNEQEGPREPDAGQALLFGQSSLALGEAGPAPDQAAGTGAPRGRRRRSGARYCWR